jgi:6-phosphofructokinase 1
MAGSREEIAIIEILGRSTGLTTMLISALAGADRTLIPEVPFDPEKLAALLVSDKQSNPNNYAILAMSEASTVVPDKASKYSLAAQAGPREVGSRVTGSGPVVTEILENITGQRLLLQPLSYLLRTGEPDGQDLLGAMNFAMMALKLLADGKTGRLVAYRRCENYVDVPLDVVTQPGDGIKLADHYDAATYSPKPSILWATRI